MRRALLVAVLLVVAASPFGAQAATSGCTVYTTGAEITPWHCEFTALGPSTYVHAAVSRWEIRRYDDDLGWQTLATAESLADAVGQGTVPTVEGDQVQLVIWPALFPAGQPLLNVYRDGFVTASSSPS